MIQLMAALQQSPIDLARVAALVKSDGPLTRRILGTSQGPFTPLNELSLETQIVSLGRVELLSLVVHELNLETNSRRRSLR